MLQKALLLALLMIAPKVHAQGGIGSSGGGDIVISRDGKVHLVDLIDSEHDQNQFLDERDARDWLYRDFKNGVSNYVLKSKPEHLDLAKGVLEKNQSRFPIFQFVLQQSMQSLSIAETDAYLKPLAPLMIEKLVIQSLSERTAANKQVVAALFDFNVLLVNRIVFEKLSPRDQSALIVHEALRNLNYFLDKKDVLSTHDIESIVRMIFLNESNPEMERKLAQLKAADFKLDLDSILKSGAANPLVSYDALLMKQFQLWGPTQKYSLNQTSFFALESSFSKVVANVLWHVGKVTVKGQFNVFSYDINCDQFPKHRKSGREAYFLINLDQEYQVDACMLANSFTRIIQPTEASQANPRAFYLSVFYK